MESRTSLFDLTGSSALVTGATRGIGFEIARALGRQGARVTITGRKPEGLSEAVERLQADKIDVIGIPCHQGEPMAIQQLFTRLDEEKRAPDVVVINAATNPFFGPMMTLETDAWHKIVDVNLTGSLLTVQHAARRMLINQAGSVIFISSVAALSPIAGLGPYGISKVALLGMMRSFAKELGPKGIRVNAIAPGLIETRFSEALFEDKAIYEAMMQRTPLGRHGQPEDLVGTAVYLASAASRYVTGQVLVVDGGGQT